MFAGIIIPKRTSAWNSNLLDSVFASIFINKLANRPPQSDIDQKNNNKA